VNEEEVKVKYVLPWLEQTGVELQEIQLERTFSIKVGRHSVSIGKDSAAIRAGARLDILVRRGDRNLFIVETKAAGESLTDGDRDQAVSYARLVHPVAPFAIVTNGSEYRIYNALTKERIDPAQIRIGNFQAVLPESDIAEAQRLFLGLRRSNLAIFCQQQVASELRLVRGTLDESRKYVSDPYVTRESIQKEVAGLYDLSLPALLLAHPNRNSMFVGSND
jgi:hypothetical protein